MTYPPMSSMIGRHSPTARKAAAINSGDRNILSLTRLSMTGLARLIHPRRLAANTIPNVPITPTFALCAHSLADRSSSTAVTPGCRMHSASTWDSPGPRSHAATRGGTRPSGAISKRRSPRIVSMISFPPRPASTSATTEWGIRTACPLRRAIHSSPSTLDRKINGEALTHEAVKHREFPRASPRWSPGTRGPCGETAPPGTPHG